MVALYLALLGAAEAGVQHHDLVQPQVAVLGAELRAPGLPQHVA